MLLNDPDRQVPDVTETDEGEQRRCGGDVSQGAHLTLPDQHATCDAQNIGDERHQAGTRLADQPRPSSPLSSVIWPAAPGSLPADRDTPGVADGQRGELDRLILMLS